MFDRSRFRFSLVFALVVAVGCAVPVEAQPAMSEQELAYLREGVRHHDAGDYDSAIALYRKALEIDASNATAHHQIGFAYMVQGDYEECLAAARKGLAVASPPMAELFAMAASCLDDLERYEEAGHFFAEGNKQFPSNQRLLYNYAVHKTRIEEPEEALALSARALDVEPHHASSHSLAAMVLGFNERDDLALLAALRFLSLEPGGDRAFSLLGTMESLFRRQEVALAAEQAMSDANGVEAADGRSSTVGREDKQTEELTSEENPSADGSDDASSDDEGTHIGTLQFTPPESEEQEQRLIDIVLSATAASSLFSPDGEPRFPTYARRPDIVALVGRAADLDTSQLSAAEKRLAARYAAFFGDMEKAGVTEAFSQYVLQLAAEEVQGWAADNQAAIEQLGLFLQSH